MYIFPVGVFDVFFLLYFFSLAEISIHLKERSYETISRIFWRTIVYRGSLDDFRAVYVSCRNSVSLVYKKRGLRVGRVLPIGSAGFGRSGAKFAQEVGRLTGLEVVTKL